MVNAHLALEEILQGIAILMWKAIDQVVEPTEPLSKVNIVFPERVKTIVKDVSATLESHNPTVNEVLLTCFALLHLSVGSAFPGKKGYQRLMSEVTTILRAFKSRLDVLDAPSTLMHYVICHAELNKLSDMDPGIEVKRKIDALFNEHRADMESRVTGLYLALLEEAKGLAFRIANAKPTLRNSKPAEAIQHAVRGYETIAPGILLAGGANFVKQFIHLFETFNQTQERLKKAQHTTNTQTPAKQPPTTGTIEVVEASETEANTEFTWKPPFATNN